MSYGYLKETHGLILRQSGALVRPRQFHVLDGLGTSKTVGAFNNSLENVIAALVLRLFYRKINGVYLPTYSTYPPNDRANMLNEYNRLLRVEVDGCAAPIPWDQYPGLYSGRKRQVYEQAFAKLFSVGLEDTDSHIRMFLKFEKDIRSDKVDRVPRLISPSQPPYLLATGCYIKPVEEQIYHAIDRVYGYPVVTKGMNYVDLAAVIAEDWDCYTNPCSIDLDVAKLDASVYSGLLAKNHELIASCYIEKNDVMKLLSKQLVSIVKGKTSDGSFAYKMEGSLSSGQVNTSLVGVHVCTGILYDVCRKYQIRLKNAGDDNKLTMQWKGPAHDKIVRGALVSAFFEHGMVVTMEPTVFEIEQSVFCKTQLVWVNGSYQSIREPVNAMTKDAVCIDRIEAPHLKAAWALAVADGGISCHGGVPIMQDFYVCMRREATRYLRSLKLAKRQRRKVNGFKLKSWEDRFFNEKLGRKYVENLETKTRLSFYLATGIPPSHQQLLEKYYVELKIDFGTVRSDQLFNPLGSLY